jgi:hypothetical protein
VRFRVTSSGKPCHSSHLATWYDPAACPHLKHSENITPIARPRLARILIADPTGCTARKYPVSITVSFNWDERPTNTHFRANPDRCPCSCELSGPLPASCRPSKRQGHPW